MEDLQDQIEDLKEISNMGEKIRFTADQLDELQEQIEREATAWEKKKKLFEDELEQEKKWAVKRLNNELEEKKWEVEN